MIQIFEYLYHELFLNLKRPVMHMHGIDYMHTQSYSMHIIIHVYIITEAVLVIL